MVVVRPRSGSWRRCWALPAEASWAARARLRAGVIAAVAGCVVGRVVGCAARSAGGGGERFELVEGGEQLGGPWPVVLEAQLAASSVDREPCGDVQQSVAQPFGLGRWRARRRAAAPGSR